MIITITLNPCIDKSTIIEVLEPETKLRSTEIIYEPGGGGINVSKALKKLSQHSLALLPSGGHNGAMLQQLLKDEDIEFAAVDTEVETRESWMVLETNGNLQYRFNFPGRPIEEHVLRQLLNKLQLHSPNLVVASGSLPQGVNPNFYGVVSEFANAVQAKCIIDTSGEALIALQGKNAYLIKPNLAELCKLMKVETMALNDVDDAAQQLVQNGFANLVAVSLGPDGAWIVGADEKHFAPAPKVKKISTVGAGDSMVAGMAYMLQKGETLQNTIKFGVCCGTAATLNRGSQLFNADDVWKFYNSQ